jgi:hypothetical protein
MLSEGQEAGPRYRQSSEQCPDAHVHERAKQAVFVVGFQEGAEG